MSPKYCLPIIKNQPSEVLETVKDNLTDYSYLEVWLDYIAAVDETFIRQLMKLGDSQLVVLFRRQHLEAIEMSLAQRLQILEMLNNSSVCVDLDIDSQLPEIEHISKAGLTIRTILSYHNYHSTPADAQLQATIATMETFHPAVYKLATLCQNEQDALRLLQHLLEFKARGAAAIVLGMGEFGLITRLFGTLWGNEMAFAPRLAAEQSASGQLTREQMEIIFKELGY